MCYNIQLTAHEYKLEKRLNAGFLKPGLYHPPYLFNGFTHPHTPVIANGQADVIDFLQWGLIPSWAKDDSIKKMTLNAKIETLSEKPAFRNVVTNRCLVITDGFFEWQWLDEKGKEKQKYLITSAETEVFTLAGLWSRWTDRATGEEMNTYTIVTTVANELMSKIHNHKKRMPVVLNTQNECDWLNGAPIELFRNCDSELLAKEC